MADINAPWCIKVDFGPEIGVMVCGPYDGMYEAGEAEEKIRAAHPDYHVESDQLVSPESALHIAEQRLKKQ